jgi:hypothetical protein
VLTAIVEYNPCTTGRWAQLRWGRALSFAPTAGTMQAAESFMDPARGQVQSETTSSHYRTDGSLLVVDEFCSTGSIAEPEATSGQITYTATTSELVVENESDCSPGIEIDVFTYAKR